MLLRGAWRPACREHDRDPAGCERAADFNVYWGEGGVVDSVIDVTHNVPVPFRADRVSASWGILNPSARSTGAVNATGAPTS